MNILYISSLCSHNKFKIIFENTKIKPAQQAQKYHQLMVKGLAKNEGNIKVISPLLINRKMTNRLFFKSEREKVNGIEYQYLSFINLPILRQVFLFLNCFFHTMKWCINHKNGVVICDVLNITVSCATLIASKITKVTSIGIVTDVPIYLARMSNRKLSFKKKIIMLINTFIMNEFNSYVFLTKYMNELINKKQKPFVVIEGLVDINMELTINDLNNKYEKKVCIYAGALKGIYGIKMLAEAFALANVNNSELHIYGNGDFEEELKKLCLEYPTIKYFGVVPNDIVVKEQLKATLLINPRPTNEEYTKYSFPSKNMEYMVSGTPTLTTNLPGMPEEYKQYVYLIEEETVEGLINTLKKILSKPKEELHQKGMMAKKFVLENKNNVLQAKKVINMIKDKR